MNINRTRATQVMRRAKVYQMQAKNFTFSEMLANMVLIMDAENPRAEAAFEVERTLDAWHDYIYDVRLVYKRNVLNAEAANYRSVRITTALDMLDKTIVIPHYAGVTFYENERQIDYKTYPPEEIMIACRSILRFF